MILSPVPPFVQRPVSESELSGAFVLRDPCWREKIFFGGLLLLLCPPLGWPVALGYRKELIARLLSGTEPLLPEWKGHLWQYFREGLKAMGVIFGYLAPLYTFLLFLLLANGVIPDLYWIYAGLFFFVFTIFSTLSFPTAVVFWTFFSETYRIPFSLAVALMLAFVAIIFFIPAGFLQVSKSGKYMSAFNFRAAASTISDNFRGYLRAWYYSGLMSLAGHSALPLAPWGVVWCYLAIIFEFNSIVARTPEATFRGSWFEKLSRDEKILVEQTNYAFVLKSSNMFDAQSNPNFLIKLGPILVPVPHLVGRFLRLEEK